MKKSMSLVILIFFTVCLSNSQNKIQQQLLDKMNNAHPVVKTVMDGVSTVYALNDITTFEVIEKGIWIVRNNLITSVVNEDVQKPVSDIHLAQNFPNPFNPTTTIRFEIPLEKGDKGGLVTLKIYNLLGQEVATLLNNESLQSGKHEIQFDASKLTGGIYFYRLSANDGKFIENKKMILLK